MKQFVTIGAIGAVSLMASSVAMAAGVDQFVGPSVFASVDFSSTSTDFRDSTDSITFGDNDTGVAIGADYGFALTTDVLMAVGAKYSLSDAKAFRFSSTENGGTALNLDLEDHWSVFIAPGYKIGEATQLYAKLAYSEGDGVISATTSGQSASEGRSISGWGYGVGVKTFISDSAYVGLEAMITEWDKEDLDGYSLEAETTSASVHLGYKF